MPGQCFPNNGEALPLHWRRCGVTRSPGSSTTAAGPGQRFLAVQEAPPQRDHGSAAAAGVRQQGEDYPGSRCRGKRSRLCPGSRRRGKISSNARKRVPQQPKAAGGDYPGSRCRGKRPRLYPGSRLPGKIASNTLKRVSGQPPPGEGGRGRITPAGGRGITPAAAAGVNVPGFTPAAAAGVKSPQMHGNEYPGSRRRGKAAGGGLPRQPLPG